MPIRHFSPLPRSLRCWIAAFFCFLTLFVTARGVAQKDTPGAVVVGDRVVLYLETSVGAISPSERAAIVNARVKQILSDEKSRPESLRVVEDEVGGADPLLVIADKNLLGVTQKDAAAAGTTRLALAHRWAVLLRESLLQVKPLYRPEEPPHNSFMPLLLLAGLAFGIPLIANRFKRLPIPVVVGEILLGIVIGRSGFGLVHYDSWLQFLAEFGFAYLMFLSGLEVDVDLLRQRSQRSSAEKPENSDRTPQGSWKRNPVLLSLLILAITFGLAGGVSLGLTSAGLLKQPWLMGLVLSTTSLGLIVPILKERGYTSTPYGQALLVAALVADFVTMFLITVVAGWLSYGPTLKLFLGLLLLGVFALALRVGRVVVRFPRIGHFFNELSQATSQVPVRGSLALMLAFVALSETLGTEVILGAFLAGVLLSLFTDRRASDLHNKLEALGYGFFIPIFFIMVGVRFDLATLIRSPQGLILAPILIVCAFLIKIIASLPFRWLTGSWRETLAGGFLMSSRLSLIIAAAEIGLRLGLFSQTLHAAIICVALFTCVGGPLGFQLLMKTQQKRERRQALIVGAGEYGALIATRLVEEDYVVTLLDTQAWSKQARAVGANLVQGDGTNPDDLRAAGIASAETVLAVTDSDAVNEAVSREAQRLGVPHRFALIRQPAVAAALREDEIATTVTPVLSTVAMLHGMVSHPGIFELLTSPSPGKRIAEATITHAALAGRTLSSISWPGDVLVLSIQRPDGEVVVPNGSTVLRAGDTVTVIGTDDDVHETLRLVGAV